MLKCTNISTLFKTFSLQDGNTPKHWIAMDSLPPLGLRFLSVQIKSNTSTSRVSMFAWLTIDHWYHSKKPVIFGRLTDNTASTDTTQTLQKMKQDLDVDRLLIALVLRSLVFSLFLFGSCGWCFRLQAGHADL